MIHIILTILKTAGILLLILIGLILFAVLSALLVPLRYSGQGKEKAAGWREGSAFPGFFIWFISPVPIGKKRLNGIFGSLVFL